MSVPRARVDATRGLNEIARELPAKRVCFVAIPVADEPKDGGLDFSGTVEAAVPQNAPLKDGEPDLDLVDPRRMQRRVHELEAPSVPSVESAPPVVLPLLVNVEIVPDHDDALSGVVARNGLQKPGERVGVTSLDHLSEHLPRAHIKGPEQRTRTMTNVLELVAHGSVGAGVRRVRARQHLHRLFVDAQDDSVLGGLQIELADAANLGLEVRIRAVQPGPHAMRAKASGAEHPLHGGATDINANTREQLVREGLLGPDLAKGSSVAFWAAACQSDDLATCLDGDLRWAP